jgi:hypothetical protein
MRVPANMESEPSAPPPSCGSPRLLGEQTLVASPSLLRAGLSRRSLLLLCESGLLERVVQAGAALDDEDADDEGDSPSGADPRGGELNLVVSPSSFTRGRIGELTLVASPGGRGNRGSLLVMCESGVLQSVVRAGQAAHGDAGASSFDAPAPDQQHSFVFRFPPAPASTAPATSDALGEGIVGEMSVILGEEAVVSECTLFLGPFEPPADESGESLLLLGAFASSAGAQASAPSAQEALVGPWKPPRHPLALSAAIGDHAEEDV